MSRELHAALAKSNYVYTRESFLTALEVQQPCYVANLLKCIPYIESVLIMYTDTPFKGTSAKMLLDPTLLELLKNKETILAKLNEMTPDQPSDNVVTLNKPDCIYYARIQVKCDKNTGNRFVFEYYRIDASALPSAKDVLEKGTQALLNTRPKRE